jgi:hypothetical protein
MMRFRKMGVAMILAAALAAGAATTAVSASAALPVATEANVDDPCQALSEIIAFLEQRPPSRLRDFLLAQARRLFATYCAA